MSDGRSFFNNKLRNLIWQLSFLIIFLILVEGISYLILKSINSNNKAEYQNLADFVESKPLAFLYVDDFSEVLHSFKRKAQKCRGKIIYNEKYGFPVYEKTNFKCYGEELDQGIRKTTNQPGKYAHKILMFGGSTMWGTGSADRNTIPSIIQKKIISENIYGIKVLNYGFTTVTINQQLNRLRKTDFNEGDIVIFYDGGNDVFQSMINEDPNGSIIGYNQKNKMDIYVQSLKFFLSNNSHTYKILSFIKSDRNKQNEECAKSDNLKSKRLMEDGFNSYLDKIELAKFYVENKGAKFFHFLQPSLFYKDLEYSEYEKKILANSPLGQNECKIYQNRVRNGYKYYSQNYNKISNTINTNNLTNLLNSVDNNEEYFFDNLHISSSGNEIVAYKIYDVLFQNNVFN